VLPGIWSYLLYTEYDVYGPYFFLWQQSFGRFYDKIYNQKLQPSYFYINYLWGIFPFAFFLLKEIYINVLKFIKNRPIKENLTTIWNGSRDKNFVIGFWVFLYLFLISFSKFQLPQYTYWALPGGAIFLSGLLLRFPENTIKSKLILSIPSIILLSSIIIIPALIIDVSYGYWILSSLLLIVGYLFYIRIKDEILLLILPVIVVFSLISFYVFPELVKFQPSKEVSKVIKQFEPDKEYIYTFGVPFSKRSYEFYSERYMRNLFRREQLRNDLKSSEQFTLVLVALEFYPFLSDRFGDEFKYEILKEYPSYKIATPKKKFLMKKTRDKELSKVFLIKIQRK
ncbi:MAG: glycosyltransferase family 39 protein, partial [Leptospiraceae bacterium]|nr:glycosyltransferase family 39 protein [Leptospiraceae bacterium]